MLSPLEKKLLNEFQQDFPFSPTPYRDIADHLGVTEQAVLDALTELTDKKLVSRVGPVISPNRIGVSSLMAMSVPADQLAATARIINRFPEVNHNYERENYFNLWYVLIASDEEHLTRVIDSIEQQTGYSSMRLPLEADYHINLGFALEFDD